MTKLDKLQLELYPMPDFDTCSGPIDYEKKSEKISALRSAFRLGAAHAEGAFAEWCSGNGWEYQGNHLWEQSCVKGNGTWKTTSELYQLWQQGKTNKISFSLDEVKEIWDAAEEYGFNDGVATERYHVCNKPNKEQFFKQHFNQTI